MDAYNTYRVIYVCRTTGDLTSKEFRALSFSHLVDVIEDALGYVPEVTSAIKK